MKIAIISDTHDNALHVEKFLAWANANQIEAIIHCGDIVRSDTIHLLLDNFKGLIKVVFGNAELDKEEMLKLPAKHFNLEIHSKEGEWVVDNWRLYFTHQSDQVNSLALSKKYDFIFYGHTHRPWISEKAGVWLINPGTLDGPLEHTSFAVWDSQTGKAELKVLDQIVEKAQD